MHRCLLIPEIVQQICDEVDDLDRNTKLLALAQTCRIFQQPSLAALWRAIPNLVPILKCAGRDIWEVHDHMMTEKRLRLICPISPSHIELMKNYASLVRQFGAYSPTDVTPEVWETLRQALGTSVLFPNIQSLDLYDNQTMESFSLFSTKNLTFCHVFLFNDANPSVGRYRLQALVDLSTQYTGLTSVRLRSFDRPDEQQMIAATLSNCPELSQCSLTHGTLEVLQALNRCSASLRYLRFQSFVLPENGFQWPLTATGPLIFPALVDFVIGLTSIRDTISFIDYFPFTSSLENLAISTGPSNEENWLRLLQLIKDRFRSLQRLEIKASDGSVSVDLLSNNLIAMLATDFTHLSYIHITISGGFNISDEDLNQMTTSLPLLKEFRLVDGALDVRSRVTVTSLAFFARNCPSLSYLGLAFDARADKIPLNCGVFTQSLVMNRLYVSISLIDVGSEQQVANFLISLFPNIRQVSGSHRYKDRWLKVWSLMMRMQNSRLESVESEVKTE